MLDRRIKEARATDVEALRRALEALADLELQSRGISELDEDTAALPAIGPDGRPPRERTKRPPHREDRQRYVGAAERRATRLGRRRAGADARGAGLLAGAGVAVQRAALDGLVDRLTSVMCSASAVSSSPAATAASRRRKYVRIADV